MQYKLHTGDSLAELALYPDNYFDSVVTDPPYGLGREPDALEMLAAWMDSGHYEPKSRGGFMGKKWDAFVPQPALWREVYRVLKPGAHLLTFAGTRTHDLVTLALRLAGFEIRDCIYWLYGSGFPKSRDISKAIDAEILTGGSHSRDIKRAIAQRPGDSRETSTLPNNGIASGNRKGGTTNDNPATPAAREWSGWGTALKPSAEPITLARKPMSESTIAANVLKWHTGAINVDGCRVETSEKTGRNNHVNPFGSARTWHTSNSPGQDSSERIIGRWPANVIHDGSDEVEAGFPETTSGGGNKNTANRDKRNAYGKGLGKGYGDGIGGDSGSASRFFYCAKASRRDRDEGLEDFSEHYNKGSGTHSNGSANTRLGNAEERAAGITHVELEKVKNNHPTVKPVSLMRYLCRLITPPGGMILDPFTGSGSTGKAAAWEGFDFVGIDLDAGYIDMARARIEHAIREAARERIANQPALPLAA